MPIPSNGVWERKTKTMSKIKQAKEQAARNSRSSDTLNLTNK